MRVPVLLCTSAISLIAVLGLVALPTVAASDAANVTLYRATDVDLDGVDAVEAAIGNGTIEPPDEVVAGETLVVAIDSERLAADLDSREGSTTDRFFEATADDADLRFVQTQATTPPSRPQKIVTIGPENATVYRNDTTTYVLVDTASIDFNYSYQNEPAELRDGDAFAVTFGYDLDGFPTDGPSFDMYTTRAEFFSSSSLFDRLPPEVVNRSVTVNVEPDESLLARATLDGNRTITAPVESVEWSSSPVVSLDVRDVEPGTEYAVELIHDGKIVDRHEGTVRTPRATVTNVEVVEVDGWTSVRVTAALSHGGEVRVLNDAGDVLGADRLDADGRSITPGDEANLTIELRGEATETLHVRAVRHDPFGEKYYRGPDAEAIIDFGDREIQTPTPVPTATSTPSITPTLAPSTQPTPTRPPRAGTETTEVTPLPDVELSGFGQIASLVALVAFVLVATRRG